MIVYSVIFFKRELSKEYRGHRNIFTMDKAGWHTTKHLKQFDNIRLIFLPPYSPEQNPTEHLWLKIRDLKFRNTAYGPLDDVQKALIESFSNLDNNKEMVSNLTYFKWLNLDI